MPYNITNYTKAQAKKLGVSVKQSSVKGTADKRRALYKNRHDKDRKKIGSNGYYADKLLW